MTKQLTRRYISFALMTIQLPKALKSNYLSLLTIANWLMGFMLILAALLLARDIVALSFKKIEKTGPAAVPGIRMPKKSLQDYSAVVRNNPFGPSGGELKQLSAASAAALSPAVTGLLLVGTVSGPQKYSYAIFADKNNTQEVFKIGESVHGMGMLKRVERDRVLLASGGRTTEVAMIDSVVLRESDIPRSSADGTGGFAKSSGEGSFIVDKRKLQQALDKPSQMMTDARLLPNIVAGSQQGFSLSEVKPDGIFYSLGLRNGDVLLKINDFTVSNPENALQAFMALKGMDRVNLDIIRNSSRLTLTYQIR